MASLAQIAANRRNARKSTGPRTPEGKAASSQNAVKHGLTAQAVVLRDESASEFEQFRDGMLASLDPQSGVEQFLAERAVSAAWRLRRVDRRERELFEHQLKQRKRRKFFTTYGRVFAEDCAEANAYSKLSRYEGQLDRAFHRALRGFRLFRKEEQAARPNAGQAAAPEAVGAQPGASQPARPQAVASQAGASRSRPAEAAGRDGGAGGVGEVGGAGGARPASWGPNGGQAVAAAPDGGQAVGLAPAGSGERLAKPASAAKAGASLSNSKGPADSAQHARPHARPSAVLAAEQAGRRNEPNHGHEDVKPVAGRRNEANRGGEDTGPVEAQRNEAHSGLAGDGVQAAEVGPGACACASGAGAASWFDGGVKGTIPWRYRPSFRCF